MSNSTEVSVIIERIQGADLLAPSDMYPVRFEIELAKKAIPEILRAYGELKTFFPEKMNR